MTLRFSLLSLLFIYYANGFCQEQKAVPIESVKGKSVTVPIYDFENLHRLLQVQDDTIRIFNFWATWCAPCVKEIPYFEQMQEEFSRQKVKVILVSLDFKSKVKDQLIPFLEKRNMKAEVLVLSQPNPNSWIDKVDSSWSGAIPATYIAKGSVKKFYEQEFTLEELRKEINTFIQ